MLLARMATRRAKPDGQFLISPDMALEHLTDVPVSEIPGVGYQKLKKLKDLRIETCGQMQDMPQSELERLFGPKTGEKLFQYCRGVCDRKIQTSRRRKNIGLDVNYGIRFDQAHEVVNFMDKMCAEVRQRK
jgi:DNA repair protein REV1